MLCGNTRLVKVCAAAKDFFCNRSVNGKDLNHSPQWKLINLCRVCAPGWIGCIPALGKRVPRSSPVFIKINEQLDIFSPPSESIILILMRANGDLSLWNTHCGHRVHVKCPSGNQCKEISYRSLIVL